LDRAHGASTVLLSLVAPAPARGSPVVMADPVFGQSARGRPRADYRSSDLDRTGLVFTPLAGSAAEAKACKGCSS
jgi:hypothetical protein